MNCPCQSGKSYEDCCQPYHQGQPAPTPEALMRSRYSAYCRGRVEYLMKTTHREHPEFRRDKGTWRVELARYCHGVEGLGLSILETEPTTCDIAPETREGWVSFEATLKLANEPAFTLAERSHFVRNEAGFWQYHAGTATITPC